MASVPALAGVVGSRHDFSARSFAPNGACTACHLPHKAVLYPDETYPLVLWSRNMGAEDAEFTQQDAPNYVPSMDILCYDCHVDAAAASPTPDDDPSDWGTTEPQSIAWGDDGPGGTLDNPDYVGFYELADGNHPKDGMPPTDGSKTGGHYWKDEPSGTPDYARGDKIPCSVCHDPHDARTGGNEAMILEETSDGSGGSITIGTNLDASANSRNGSGTGREICAACHSYVNSGSPVTMWGVSLPKPPPLKAHEQANATPCTNCHHHNYITASCDGCHGYPPPPPESGYAGINESEGPHPLHADARDAGGYGFLCDYCHGANASEGDHAGHENTLYNDVPFVTERNPNTDPITSYVEGTRTCNDLYCHSDGTGWLTATGSEQWTADSWVSLNDLGCEACHGNSAVHPEGEMDYGAPDYANGTLKANSHAAHGNYPCAYCHYNITRDLDPAEGWDFYYEAANPDSYGRALHVNNTAPPSFTYNVDPATNACTSDAYFDSYTYDAAGGTCVNIDCHGGKNAQWGTTLDCTDCHVGAADADNFGFPEPAAPPEEKGAFEDCTVSQVSSSEWMNTGHGKGGTWYDWPNRYGKGGPAEFGPSGCISANANEPTGSGCHRADVPHGTRENPYRLATYDVSTYFFEYPSGTDPGSLDQFCQHCHQEAQTATHSEAVTGYSGVNNWQTYAAQGSPTEFKCVDCHDPHGDTPDFMMQAKVWAGSSDEYGDPPQAPSGRNLGIQPPDPDVILFESSEPPLQADYVDLTGGSSEKICQVCHQANPYFTKDATKVDHYVGPNDGCVVCHTHDVGFAPSCDGCHGNPPPDSPFAGTTQTWTSDKAASPDSVGEHATHWGGGYYDTGTCNSTCHVGDSHLTNKVTANMGVQASSTGVFQYGTWTNGGTDGITSVVDDTCVNINCHNSTYPAGNPNQFMSAANPGYIRYWNQNLDCYACHAYDGSDSALRPGAEADDRMSSGSHDLHVNADGLVATYQCVECHVDNSVAGNGHKDGNLDFSFATDPYGVAETVSSDGLAPTDGVSRAYGTCTNVYCHSSVQTSPPGGNPTYATPTWGTDILCGDCHEGLGHNPMGAITTGSHQAHQYLCQKCHFRAGASYCLDCHMQLSTSPPPDHVNGFIEVRMEAEVGPVTLAGIYDTDADTGTDEGGGLPGAAYGQCANAYCHSDARTVKSGAATGSTYATITWGTADPGCEGCHGVVIADGGTTYQYGAPDYINSGLVDQSANSHEKHVSSSIACAECHNGSITDADPSDGWTLVSVAIPGESPHADGVIGVVIAAAWDGDADGTNNYTPATKVCTDVSCHGAGSPVWGGTVTCTDCHGRTTAEGGDLNNWSGNDGTLSRIDTDENTAVGHAAQAIGCTDCHGSTIGHDTSADLSGGNPFRLDNVNIVGQEYTDPDTFCSDTTNCHTGASSSQVVSHTAANMTADQRTWLWTPKCVDCHDPHGDASNLAMVQLDLFDGGSTGHGVPNASDADTVDYTLSGGIADGSYADTTDANGICQECHLNAGTGQLSFLDDDTTPLAGSHPTSGLDPCSACHVHNTAFEPSGCEGCHGGADGTQVHQGINGGLGDDAPSVTTYWWGSVGGLQDGGHGDPDGRPAVECSGCHDIGQPNPSTHLDGTLNSAETGTNTNTNTAHLKVDYINTDSGNDYNQQITFDTTCWTLCHLGSGVFDMRHSKDADPVANAVQFGQKLTISDGESIRWPVDSDVTTHADVAPNDFAPCVSCHNPHGTGVNEPTKPTGNRMVRARWQKPPQLCHECHY